MVECAVVGASGYAGAELVALLAGHPQVRLRSLHADGNAGRRWEDLYPARAAAFSGVLEPFTPERVAGCDVVFLAQPSGASATAAAALEGRVGCIVDLSGDLRLPDAASYRAWYGKEHPAPHLLGRAAYGLPELFADEIRGARLIACAGCYATAVQLAAWPALAHEDARGFACAADVVACATSGTTGAGRKAELELQFSEVAESVRPYRVGRHQHVPEMAGGLGRRTGRDVRVTFVPQLAPLRRGIAASVVLRLERAVTQAEVDDLFRKAYATSPFVRVLDPQVRLPQTADVAGTNRADLAAVVDEAGGTLVVLAAIDNLVKGAAGQAVQVMNIACGLPETAGLVPGAKEDLGHV